jgi:FkbM family methyltransferase
MPDPIALPGLIRLFRRNEFPKKLGICERLFRGSLARNGVCWVETSAGIPWKLDLANATHRWIVYGKYEGAPFLDWAKRFLPADGVIVDSGANVGQMLLYLAQWVPKGSVLAVEPGKHQADWLQECLAANPQLPVELIRVGLGAASQNAFLQETGTPDRHGSWNQVSQSEGEPIQIVRLADLLAKRGIERVDLWKLDVEGFEIQALEGARPLLESHRIRALYVELLGENGPAIREYLQPLGYKCWLFKPNGKLYSPTALPDDTNGLFLPV